MAAFGPRGDTDLTSPRPLIAGNWKMNGLQSAIGAAAEVAGWVEAHAVAARVAICPPATLVQRMAARLAGGGVEVGGQDCRAEPSGAFTGDISAEMLVDAGASLVILGHSERREGYGESDALVSAKVEAALRAGLEPIICVGETLKQRRAGDAVAVVSAQIRGSLPLALAARAFAVAYEPIWAIGSGLTPSVAEIEAVHLAIRHAMIDRLGGDGAAAPILYGGSVKGSNAPEILRAAQVGGALVGGASLTAEAFCAILAAA
jgi:triosephosphate isomerase